MEINLAGILDMPSSAVATAVAEPPRPAPVSPSQPKARATRTTKQPLYFDLETVPDEDRMELFGLEPLPELPPITTVANLMEPAEFLSQTLSEIKTWLGKHNPPETWLVEIETAEKSGPKAGRKGLFDEIADVRGRVDEVENAVVERQKLLSVTPEYNRIVAVAAARGAADVNASVVGDASPISESPLTEADLIEQLWFAIEECGPLIGFNVLWFDLPTLFVRSALLKIKPTKRLDLKPWGGDVVDLARVRFPSQTPKGMGLKNLARIYGIPVPAGDTDGSDVYRLWREEPAKLAEYVKSDVEVTRKLHKFYSGTFCS